MAVVTAPSQSYSYVTPVQLTPPSSLKGVYVGPARAKIPFWRMDAVGQAFLNIDTHGVISGYVVAETVGVGEAIVLLHDRLSKMCIGCTTSGADGSFSFDGLDRNSSDYYVLVLKTPYAAKIFDRVTPV